MFFGTAVGVAGTYMFLSTARWRQEISEAVSDVREIPPHAGAGGDGER